MNISQALKEKNRRLKRLAELQNLVSKNNVVREDDPSSRSVDIGAAIELVALQIASVAEIRAKIAQASAPIQEKIARLGLVASWRGIVATLSTDGEPIDVGHDATARTINRTVQVDLARQRDLLAKLDQEIADLQDQIDDFNATTKV